MQQQGSSKNNQRGSENNGDGGHYISLRVINVLEARGDKIEKLSYFFVKIRGVLATNAPIFHNMFQTVVKSCKVGSFFT